jgi:hypothetical protein
MLEEYFETAFELVLPYTFPIHHCQVASHPIALDAAWQHRTKFHEQQNKQLRNYGSTEVQRRSPVYEVSSQAI